MIDNSKDIDEYIEEFRKDFYKRYGMYPKVMYDMTKDMPVVSLETILKVADNLLLLDPSYKKLSQSPKFTNGIRSKYRHATLVIYRQVCFKIARDYKYPFERIGIVFDCNHATVLSGVNVMNDHLTTFDHLSIDIYNSIRNAIKKNYRLDGDVLYHIGAESDS